MVWPLVVMSGCNYCRCEQEKDIQRGGPVGQVLSNLTESKSRAGTIQLTETCQELP